MGSRTLTGQNAQNISTPAQLKSMSSKNVNLWLAFYGMVVDEGTALREKQRALWCHCGGEGGKFV